MIDYKKIIPDRSLRLKILSFMSLIPDEVMLRLQYRIKMGRNLNLKNPRRFSEKIQWYKLHYKNVMMIRCVDKYDVREYVKERGLEKILIPCYGVYDSVDSIDWEKLHNQFVMKDTLGGGGRAVVVVRDKEEEDIGKLREIARKWLAVDAKKKDDGREWPYNSGKPHRIIIEKYIGSNSKEGLIDYKFFCFNGRVEMVYVMGERRIGECVKVSLYNRDFKMLNVQRVGDAKLENVKKPSNYDEMLEIAERLSDGFPHVRVDLYSEGGAVYFGELTFFNASGYVRFDPDEYDYELGKYFELRYN